MLVVSPGRTAWKQQKVLLPETENISSVISKLGRENVFAPSRVTQSFEPKNYSQPEFHRNSILGRPPISLNANPTHTPEPYNSVKQMFDLIWYVNLILSHGISELCLQVWNLNISLPDLDSFDLPSLHSQVLITRLKSPASAPGLQPMAAKCVHVYIDLCWDQNGFRLRKCLSDGGGSPAHGTESQGSLSRSQSCSLHPAGQKSRANCSWTLAEPGLRIMPRPSLIS